MMLRVSVTSILNSIIYVKLFLMTMIMTFWNIIYVAAVVIVLFGAAVFVHEFGHFWMARRRGMKVEAFAIGFGPKLFGWTRDGIDYAWRAIPAGGYVKLPQMTTAAMLEGESMPALVLSDGKQITAESKARGLAWMAASREARSSGGPMRVAGRTACVRESWHSVHIGAVRPVPAP